MAENGIDLKNIREFQKFFKALPGQLSRRVERQALIASGKPIKQEMKNNLKRHRRTGTLIKAIKVVSAKKGRGGRTGEVSVLVGAIKSSNVRFLPDGFYARFLEMGTSKQPPRPWARPAIDSTIGQQRRELAREYGRRGLKEIKRQARKIIGFQ